LRVGGERLVKREAAPGHDIRAAVGRGGLVLVGPGLVVDGRVTERRNS
jgi:hypothetical protein